MRNQLAFWLFILMTSTLFAQKGTIKGTLTDRDLNNEPLPFANVLVKGTTTGASSDESGNYAISIEAGTYTLEFSFLGYETITETVTVVAGQTVTVNKALGAGSYTLKDVVIQTQVNKEKETALLMDQKNAVEIKQNIGAQELSRKGVTDVAGAVAKTTGVTRQEGTGNIYVRGMGDRYNSSTMNGLPIPSNDAEKKNIALDIFPTEIVEYVSIDKVYASRLYGDYAGGNIDIVSKEYKGNGMFRVDMGMNGNTNALGADNFSLREQNSAFGFSKPSIPSNPLTQYNYDSYKMDRKVPFAGSLGISAGDSWNVGEEGKFSVFVTGAIGNDYTSIEDGKANGSISPTGVINKEFESYKSYNYATNTTGMLNLGYKFNNRHKINFNSLFINSTKQSTEDYFGRVVDLANDGNGLLRINLYKKTSLFVNQLIGEHKLGDRTKLNWALGYNAVKDDQPDRTWNFFNQVAGGYLINSQSAPNNNRYWQALDETEINALVSADYKFKENGEGDYKGKLTVGYNGRMKKRDFEASQFNFKGLAPHTLTVVQPDNLDAFFNGANLAAGQFEISTFRGNFQVPNALVPQTYSGDLDIHAAFATIEYKFNPKLVAVLGLRGEYLKQYVQFDTSLNQGENELDKTAILPNLTVKYELNEKQNLRFAFSKTYTLPQFKERAPFAYERATQVTFGNQNLYESDNYNLDIKWEMFPNSEELISFTAFGKYILNPMNEITINSSTNDISYANTGDYGYAVGGELELRKLLYSTDEENSKKFTAGANVSYLYTNQELNGDKVRDENDFEADFTNSKDAFAGASDWLANADISYFTEWNHKKSNLTATLAYNFFSDRIFAIGTMQRGNLVDKAVGTLDFVLKSKLNENIGIGITARNLTNPEIRQVQENAGGDVLSQTYRKGMLFGLGVSYQF